MDDQTSTPPASKTPKLNDLELVENQLRFVEEYLKNGKKYTLAFKAVFPDSKFDDKRNLTKAAKRYFTIPKVQAAIALAESKALARVDRVITKYAVTKERITEELAKLAFTTAEDVMTWGPDGVIVKPSSELSDEAKASVAEVTETRSEKTGTTIKVKTYDKRAALETLGKSLGMFQEKVNHEHKHMSVSFVIEKD